MAQVVTCQPVTAEAHVQSQASICRICGGKSGTGTGFSPSTSDFAYHYHSTNALYSFIYHWRFTMLATDKSVDNTHNRPVQFSFMQMDTFVEFIAE